MLTVFSDIDLGALPVCQAHVEWQKSTWDTEILWQQTEYLAVHWKNVGGKRYRISTEWFVRTGWILNKSLRLNLEMFITSTLFSQNGGEISSTQHNEHLECCMTLTLFWHQKGAFCHNLRMCWRRAGGKPDYTWVWHNPSKQSSTQSWFVGTHYTPLVQAHSSQYNTGNSWSAK